MSMWKETRNNIWQKRVFFKRDSNKPGFVGLWVIGQRGLAQGNFGQTATRKKKEAHLKFAASCWRATGVGRATVGTVQHFERKVV